MTPWQYWAGSVEDIDRDDCWPLGEFETRDEAIAAANREYAPGTPFRVIEARSSTDAQYYDGSHEIIPFLRVRNGEWLTTGVRKAAA